MMDDVAELLRVIEIKVDRTIELLSTGTGWGTPVNMERSLGEINGRIAGLADEVRAAIETLNSRISRMEAANGGNGGPEQP